jgi:N-acetyl-gamma-glutamyl-phosphate reductase
MKVGIIGGAGYTAGELLRLLINHPNVEISFVHSSSNAGNRITDVHQGLMGETDIVFSDTYDLTAIDLLFLCSAHGDSSKFLSANPAPEGLKIIDLAQDFRDESNGFVYGLPEMNRSRIATATRIANPGCFATALQLSILPLATAGKLVDEIHITAATGSTGAGVKPGATTHFSWRSDNLSVYKAFEHQHLKEVARMINRNQPSYDKAVNFVPMRGDFARGIFASVYTKCDMSIDEALQLYRDYYKDAAYTFVVDKLPDLKQVVNTNKALIGLERHGDKLLIVTVIDNLLKGASGQAVQNMNIMNGWDEHTGLRLKPSAF